MSNELTPTLNQNTPTGTTGLVLGLITMVLWFIPLLGLPLSIWGLISSIKAKKLGTKGRATAGMVLCIISLTLGVMNASVGAYMGATGQHGLVNKLRR